MTAASQVIAPARVDGRERAGRPQELRTRVDLTRFLLRSGEPRPSTFATAAAWGRSSIWECCPSAPPPPARRARIGFAGGGRARTPFRQKRRKPPIWPAERPVRRLK